MNPPSFVNAFSINAYTFEVNTNMIIVITNFLQLNIYLTYSYSNNVYKLSYIDIEDKKSTNPSINEFVFLIFFNIKLLRVLKTVTIEYKCTHTQKFDHYLKMNAVQPLIMVLALVNPTIQRFPH